MLLGMPSLSLGASCPYPDMQTCPLSLYNLPVYLCANNITKMAHLWTILILRDIESLTPVIGPCQRSNLINKGQVNGFVCRGGIQTEAIVLAAQRQSSQIAVVVLTENKTEKWTSWANKAVDCLNPKKRATKTCSSSVFGCQYSKETHNAIQKLNLLNTMHVSAMIW